MVCDRFGLEVPDQNDLRYTARIASSAISPLMGELKLMASYQPGDYVKVEFQDERSGQSEWMWVKVDRADDQQRLVFGKLDNEPLVSADLRLGMELVVSYDQIREHMKASAFNQ